MNGSRATIQEKLSVPTVSILSVSAILANGWFRQHALTENSGGLQKTGGQATLSVENGEPDAPTTGRRNDRQGCSSS